METQLKKGFLDIIILASLKSGDSYGYKIIQDIQPVFEITESTLYPILKRLEVQNYLRSYISEYNGRQRKYFSLTDAGYQRIKDFRNEWIEFYKIIEFIDKNIYK